MSEKQHNQQHLSGNNVSDDATQMMVMQDQVQIPVPGIANRFQQNHNSGFGAQLMSTSAQRQNKPPMARFYTTRGTD